MSAHNVGPAAWIVGNPFEWDVQIWCTCGRSIYYDDVSDEARCDCGRVWSYEIRPVLLSAPDASSAPVAAPDTQEGEVGHG